MAQIKIESIVDRLDSEFKRVGENVFQEVAPDAGVDRSDAFRAFVRAVDREFSSWVTVPDAYVKKT